jgi:hypothetical protein
MDTGTLSGNTNVLTGKPAADEVNVFGVWLRPGPHVVPSSDVWPVLGEHSPAEWIALNLPPHFHPGPLEAEFNSAYSRKQTSDTHLVTNWGERSVRYSASRFSRFSGSIRSRPQLQQLIHSLPCLTPSWMKYQSDLHHGQIVHQAGSTGFCNACLASAAVFVVLTSILGRTSRTVQMISSSLIPYLAFQSAARMQLGSYGSVLGFEQLAECNRSLWPRICLLADRIRQVAKRSRHRLQVLRKMSKLKPFQHSFVHVIGPFVLSCNQHSSREN